MDLPTAPSCSKSTAVFIKIFLIILALSHIGYFGSLNDKTFTASEFLIPISDETQNNTEWNTDNKPLNITELFEPTGKIPITGTISLDGTIILTELAEIIYDTKIAKDIIYYNLFVAQCFLFASIISLVCFFLVPINKKFVIATIFFNLFWLIIYIATVANLGAYYKTFLLYGINFYTPLSICIAILSFFLIDLLTVGIHYDFETHPSPYEEI